MKHYVYPLAMVFVAIVGAAALVGWGWCDQRGGCAVVTGKEMNGLVLGAVIHGANVGYAAGAAATCGKDGI